MPDDGRPKRSSWAPVKSKPVERPLPIDGWMPSSLDDVTIGDLVTVCLMRPLLDSLGKPMVSKAKGTPFPIRAGVGIVARVVGEDLEGDGALLIERTGFSQRARQNAVLPPVLTRLSSVEMKARGAWVYRHREHGPADRSGSTGARELRERLLQAAGGGPDDGIVVDRVAGCVAPETTTGAAPAKLGRIRATMMLAGEVAPSETVIAQLLAMPPIVWPKPKSTPHAMKRTVGTGAGTDDEPQLSNEPRRDAILSLRWEMKGHWEGLREELPGISKTGAAIAIAAWQEHKTAGRPVSYSRTADHYTAREASPLYTFEKVKSGVDFLDRVGLLSDHFRQVKGGRGIQSHFRGSEELVRIVDDVLGSKPRLVPRRPNCAVVVRDKAGAAMALPDTRALRRQVQRVEAINEHVRAADLSRGVGACYTRIYHENLTRGGRWYADGMSWQNLHKDIRRTIRIDDEETIELDYGAFHATMIYSLVGESLPDDAYTIGKWHRDLVKIAFLTMLNARSRGSAIGSIGYGQIIRLAGQVPGTTEALQTAANVVDDVARAHRRIEKAFFSDAGAGLMKRDSDMASEIMWSLMRDGVTSLCVHDSFRVKASNEGELRDVMARVANDFGMAGIRIKVV